MLRPEVRTLIEILTETTPEYEAFLSAHPRGTLFQSGLWAGVKKSWRWRAVVFRRDGEIAAGMSILLRRVPGTPWKLAYAPRGPVCDPEDQEALAALTEGARELEMQENVCLLKLDPDMPLEDTGFQKSMTALGYRLLAESWNFDRIQPQHLARIDLRGKDAESVLAGMKQKTRYNIRLAERKGVEVRVCGAEHLPEFCRLMKTTGIRDGFAVRPCSYFEGMLRSLGTHAKLFMAYYNGIPLAGAIAAQFGNKTWYLYGASADEGRDKMANYLLQWNMIRWAIESGCDWYDFRGVSGGQGENKTKGLWRFKGGFGAELQTLVGEYELPLKPAACVIVKRLIPLFQRCALFFASLRTRSEPRTCRRPLPGFSFGCKYDTIRM